MGKQDAGESDFVDGVIEKKGYRKRWIRYAEKEDSHPFNHGVHMDTHHLISAESVNISELEDILIEKGYNINAIDNLVGLPATLPAACHLGVQLHRGDHLKARPGEKPYHDYVSVLLLDEKEDMKKCYGRTKKIEDNTEIHLLLASVCKKVLKKINNFTLPLTDIFLNFKSRSGKGCQNCFDVTPALATTTSCEHKTHFGVDYRYQDSNVNGNKREITFNANKNWKPEIFK